jgi:predicted DNA-binding transcriptional regulator YafY
MSDTVMRYIAMLKLLPSHAGGITAGSLHAKLHNLGYGIDKRSVERDLLTLSGAFPITSDEGRPASWHWMRDAPFTALPGMDAVTALTLELVSRYLTPLLPPRVLQPLAPQLVAARQVLDEANSADLGRWTSRIVVVPQGQPLLAPKVTPEVTAVVYEALCAGKRFEVSYRSVDAERAKRYPISPLGLVVRGGVIYLVGTALDYDDPCVYALHRMSNPQSLDEPATTPSGFDLEHYVREEHTFEFPQGRDVRLELRVSAVLANHLRESRLAVDQQIAPIRGSERWRVRATVADTEQLVWWLLGFGAQVEVVRPIGLRKRVAQEVLAVRCIYE